MGRLLCARHADGKLWRRERQFVAKPSIAIVNQLYDYGNCRVVRRANLSNGHAGSAIKIVGKRLACLHPGNSNFVTQAY
jgi:hypothetical protein